MSDELAVEIRTELGLLSQHVHALDSLIEQCKSSEPTAVEKMALAGILHGFYTGVERVFRSIALSRDGEAPSGAFWHSELCERMAAPTDKRPAVLSKDFALVLEQYMDFRHVFRHAYSWELHWRKMAPLVLGLHQTLERFEQEVEGFLRSIQGV